MPNSLSVILIVAVVGLLLYIIRLKEVPGSTAGTFGTGFWVWTAYAIVLVIASHISPIDGVIDTKVRDVLGAAPAKSGIPTPNKDAIKVDLTSNTVTYNDAVPEKFSLVVEFTGVAGAVPAYTSQGTKTSVPPGAKTVKYWIENEDKNGGQYEEVKIR